MKYNLKERLTVDRFDRRCKQLIDSGALVELREARPPRSNQQNKYLHLIIGLFAMEYGEDMDYIKQHFFKTVVNKELFITTKTNHKTGATREALRSTSDLDSGEMTLAIDRFRNWSSQQGIYLPAPNESEYLKQIMIEMELNKQYL